MNFEICLSTPYEFMTLYLHEMELKKVLSAKMMKSVDKVSLYLMKLIVYDYDLLNSNSFAELAAGVVYIVFKVIESLDSTFPLK